MIHWHLRLRHRQNNWSNVAHGTSAYLPRAQANPLHVIASLSLPVCPQPSTSAYQIARSKFIACSSPRRMVVKNWVRSCQGMERSSTDSTNQCSPRCLKIFARSVSVLASLHEVASCRCCCHVRLISCNADVSQISVHSPS
jgi:hypothetical protein